MFRQPPKDAEISQPPTDTVSEIAFSPNSYLLAGSSWDNQVRVWDIQNNGTSTGKAAYSHEAPALCCAWSRDRNKGRMLDVATGQAVQIAQHDDTIRCIRFVEGDNASPIVATGSWDKTVKYWDLRQPSPLGVVTLNERIYAMDSLHPLMVVGTADRKVHVFDLNNPTQPFKTLDSPLKWQTRSLSCFVKKDGFAVGSIEGRHPVTGTFCTAGSDGSIVFWDKDARQKLKSFTNLGGPVLSTTISGDGKILAYATGYDWSKGFQHNDGTTKSTIFLHSIAEEDVKPRTK
ncbi:WD40 repeat-like protein [Linderina pennispora]|uniref:WD40 repeat-like protein n=1 Tax=Linderina pennispora TaxID=61395 RepID=A0A1Y1WAT3_9FUNG|nr:WD40 repeat-like protein [Linderina pennispora]ORX70485.1 WD40 repeat-like protein [Linderina pennispora]